MKRLYTNDLILNAAIIILSLALPFILSAFHGEGDVAIISYNGSIEKQISLDSNETYFTHGVEITVKDGYAFVSASSCPDGLCMKTKSAHIHGDSIICVPNRVSVRISGKSGEDGADVIAG